MKRKNGFTLIELILTAGLSALVLAAIGAVFTGTLTVWTRTERLNSRIDEGQLALLWLTRDIREKTIATATNNSITFTDTTSYLLQGKNLLRNQETLSQNVTKFALGYDDPLAINFVSIRLTISNNDRQLALQSGAAPRNYD